MAAFAVACADPATGPNRVLMPGNVAASVTENVIDFQGFGSYPTGVADGIVRLCKTTDAAGTFNFTVTSSAAAPASIVANPQFVFAAPGTQCQNVYESATQGVAAADQVTIVEAALPQYWANTDIAVVQHLAKRIYDNGGYVGELNDSENTGTQTATLRVDRDQARSVTFTNSYTPPPPPDICTYTKGWYRNRGSSTVIAVDGRTVAEAQAIFNATPGKPGPVTFGGNNNLLNLYQQLLAALNNLGGDPLAGPNAVDTAIADAMAGTGGTGYDITTTLSQSQMSALINTLSSFNEGEFDGFPHCDD